MIDQRRYIIEAVLLLFLLLLVLFLFRKVVTTNAIETDISGVVDNNNHNTSVASDIGRTLFIQNCTSCHNIMREMTGPALLGLEERGPWKDRKNLYDWIHNPPKFMATNSYAKSLKTKFGVMMTAFPNLQDKEIDAIVEYINGSNVN